MAVWSAASQCNEIFCHDAEVMGTDPGQVEIGVHSHSVNVGLKQKITLSTRLYYNCCANLKLGTDDLHKSAMKIVHVQLHNIV